MKQTMFTQSGVPVMLLAGPISHTSTQYMNFVEIFNILLDISTCFAHFSGCLASFVYSCHYAML